MTAPCVPNEEASLRRLGLVSAVSTPPRGEKRGARSDACSRRFSGLSLVGHWSAASLLKARSAQLRRCRSIAVVAASLFPAAVPDGHGRPVGNTCASLARH